MPVAMYENDELDMAGVGPYEVERILDPDNPLHGEHRATPELSVQYIGLNVDRPPFDDPLVRQSFTHAVDTAKIAELVLKGTAIPARGILPPGLLDEQDPSVALAYDPALARQLLAQSRYSAPGAMPEVVLSVSGSSGSMSAIDRAVLSMVEENLGIEINVEQVKWADFLRDMNAHRYQMFSAGWIGDYPDAQNFVDLLFHSASSQNHTGYANAQVDALLEQARIEAAPTQRAALYRQAEASIVSEAPWIPLTHGVSYMLVKPYVKGFHSSASLYPWLADIRLER
jgi:ABC-type oligopeptide transport system substrate-binding subunit